MDPPLSWLQWFAISIPVASFSVLAIWAYLHIGYRWEHDLSIPRMRKNTDPLTWTHWYVIGATALTIALWCMEKSFEKWVGDMGVIAIVPVVAFFGPGILSTVSTPTRYSVCIHVPAGQLVNLNRFHTCSKISTPFSGPLSSSPCPDLLLAKPFCRLVSSTLSIRC